MSDSIACGGIDLARAWCACAMTLIMISERMPRLASFKNSVPTDHGYLAGTFPLLTELCQEMLLADALTYEAKTLKSDDTEEDYGGNSGR